MKLKKLTSLIMACAMILALAVPAFASSTTPAVADFYQLEDESDQYNQSIQITTKMFIPTIVLKLPTIAENPVVLNPYRIAYDSTVDAEALLNGTAVTNTTDRAQQVISPVYAIYNQSNVKLNFEVTATTTVAGNLTLATSAPTATDKTNKAMISIVVLPDDSTATKLTTNTNAQAQGTLAVGTRGKEIKLDASKAVTVKDMYIGAVSSTDKAASKYNFIQFQFQGAMATQPTTPWAETDVLTATLAFTFTPETGTGS